MALKKNKELLVPLDMQKRILQTAYLCIHSQETSTANALITTLEDVTNGTLRIGGEIETLLYRKIYLMLVFRYAEFMPTARMRDIFSSTLFTLGIFMDMLILPALGVHIRYYSLVPIRESLSLDYAASIASNKSPFGKNAKGEDMSVQDWIVLSQKRLQHVEQKDFFTVLDADPDILANPKELLVQIQMILFLYRLLVSGFFILNEGAAPLVERSITQLEKEAQKRLLIPKEETFSDIVHQTRRQELAAVLYKTNTLQSLIEWARGFDTKELAMASIVSLLSDTIGDIPQDQTDLVAAILQMSQFLEQQGYEMDHEIIYFDETSSVFRFTTS
jgi:hypothetical protein